MAASVLALHHPYLRQRDELVHSGQEVIPAASAWACMRSISAHVADLAPLAGVPDEVVEGPPRACSPRCSASSAAPPATPALLHAVDCHHQRQGPSRPWQPGARPPGRGPRPGPGPCRPTPGGLDLVPQHAGLGPHAAGPLPSSGRRSTASIGSMVKEAISASSPDSREMRMRAPGALASSSTSSRRRARAKPAIAVVGGVVQQPGQVAGQVASDSNSISSSPRSGRSRPGWQAW